MFPHNRWHGVALPRDRGSARTVPAPSLLPYTKLRKARFRSEIPQRSSHVSAREISMRNNFTPHILTQYPTSNIRHNTRRAQISAKFRLHVRCVRTSRAEGGAGTSRAGTPSEDVLHAKSDRACQIRSHGNAPLSARSARRTFRFPLGNGGRSSLSGSRVQVQRCDFKFKVGMGNVFQEITTVAVDITQAA